MENNNKIDSDKYHISLFKPTTPLAKFNRNLILTLVSIWAVTIFGFQILLKIIEKPTPEESYKQYELVWDNLKSGKANNAEKQVFVKSALSVIGKIVIAEEDKMVLNSAISKITMELVPEAEKNNFISKIENFKSKTIGDSDYQEIKKELSEITAKYIGVKPHTLEAKLIIFGLSADENSVIDSEKIEAVMSKYLIHNQSFLTDFKFLGFPFHYFYTAVFLLILFIGLCLYYCIAIDINLKKLGIKEE